MSAPFSLPVRYSPLLRLMVVLTHVLPILSSAMAQMDPWLMWLVWLAAAFSAPLNWRKARSLAACRIEFMADGACCWQSREGAIDIELLPESRDFGFLIVLVWRELESGRVGRLALLRDGVAADEWRALRRYLRWGLSVPPRAD